MTVKYQLPRIIETKYGSRKVLKFGRDLLMLDMLMKQLPELYLCIYLNNSQPLEDTPLEK